MYSVFVRSTFDIVSHSSFCLQILYSEYHSNRISGYNECPLKTAKLTLNDFTTTTHIHILSRPGRYLGGNLARTRKFLASERKFFGQQLTVAASKSSSVIIQSFNIFIFNYCNSNIIYYPL